MTFFLHEFKWFSKNILTPAAASSLGAMNTINTLDVTLRAFAIFSFLRFRNKFSASLNKASLARIVEHNDGVSFSS